jgi:hypothetical protein
MANEKEWGGGGSAKDRPSGSEKGNPSTKRRQPIGSMPISREERFVSQQLDVDADRDGASVQTSTAQDESGQE